MQIFNRKRQGEISRLLIDYLDYSCMYKLDDANNSSEFSSLSIESKKLAKEYIRVSLINKYGKKMSDYSFIQDYLKVSILFLSIEIMHKSDQIINMFLPNDLLTKTGIVIT